MAIPSSRSSVQFAGRGTYHIAVHGSLDRDLSDHLGGLRIAASEHQDGSVRTMLTGYIPDQAALMGVLNAHYDLQLPILSATLVGSD